MPEDDNCPRNSRADCFFSRERCSFVSLKWREIFQQRAADVPTLGLDYLRAKKETRTIKFKIASSSGNSTDGYIEKDSTLMIRQDLAKFGIGGVVWDCVSRVRWDSCVCGATTGICGKQCDVLKTYKIQKKISVPRFRLICTGRSPCGFYWSSSTSCCRQESDRPRNRHRDRWSGCRPMWRTTYSPKRPCCTTFARARQYQPQCRLFAIWRVFHALLLVRRVVLFNLRGRLWYNETTKCIYTLSYYVCPELRKEMSPSTFPPQFFGISHVFHATQVSSALTPLFCDQG